MRGEVRRILKESCKASLGKAWDGLCRVVLWPHVLPMDDETLIERLKVEEGKRPAFFVYEKKRVQC